MMELQRKDLAHEQEKSEIVTQYEQTINEIKCKQIETEQQSKDIETQLEKLEQQPLMYTDLLDEQQHQKRKTLEELQFDQISSQEISNVEQVQNIQQQIQEMKKLLDEKTEQSQQNEKEVESVKQQLTEKESIISKQEQVIQQTTTQLQQINEKGTTVLTDTNRSINESFIEQQMVQNTTENTYIESLQQQITKMQHTWSLLQNQCVEFQKTQAELEQKLDQKGQDDKQQIDQLNQQINKISAERDALNKDQQLIIQSEWDKARVFYEKLFSEKLREQSTINTQLAEKNQQLETSMISVQQDLDQSKLELSEMYKRTQRRRSGMFQTAPPSDKPRDSMIFK